ncbi:hypothetical protein D3C86_1672710 [compost metagenome]
MKSFKYLRALHKYYKSKIRIISALDHDRHEAADGFMFKGGDGVKDGGRIDFKTLRACQLLVPKIDRIRGLGIKLIEHRTRIPSAVFLNDELTVLKVIEDVIQIQQGIVKRIL